MQIEETFRDLKSYRYGWSARLIRSAQLARFDVLYMIAAIAAVAMHMLGLAARGSCHARGLQANTERHRHVFSTFFLGKLVMKQGLYPKLLTAELKAGLTELVAGLQSADRIPS